MTSAVRRVRKQDRKEARELLAMCIGLDSTQATDVLAWALHGRAARGARGIAAYTPTDPVELNDGYIERQYEFADKRNGANG